MASTINSALNQLLASNFSEISKVASPYARPPQVQPPLIEQAEDSENATLAQQQNQGQQQALVNQQSAERRQTLKDLSGPQVALSPSDEVALFTSEEAVTTALPQEITQSNYVSDETNRARRQALTGGDNLAQVLQSRAQQAVSSLYARNNDIIYNATPVLSEAA